METITLGRTGRQVSRIGFGGATAGLKNYLGSFDPQDHAQRDAILQAMARALELGINYFDTAPGYGDGASEAIFGEALASTPPEKILLATKVGIWKDAEVRASLEASLKRLRRDQIDLLQIHGTVYSDEHRERVLRSGGFLDQMRELQSEGLVRHLGFTAEGLNPPVWEFIKTGAFDVMQIQYNLLFQHPYLGNRKSGLLVDAKAQSMGTIAMRTLTSGLFQRWHRAIRPSDDFDYTPHLLQFALSTPTLDVALLGMRSAQEVAQNVAICNDTAARQDLHALNDAYASQ